MKDNYGLISDEGDCAFDNLDFVKELKKFNVLYFFSASYIGFHTHVSNAITHLPILNLSKNMREVAKEEIISSNLNPFENAPILCINPLHTNFQS